MADRLELSYIGEPAPIETVGDLLRILDPFRDSCPITPIRVFYVGTESGCGCARLEIEINLAAWKGEA